DEEILNIALKDPLQTLNNEYHAFVKARGLYNQVCEVSAHNFCAASLHQIGRLAETKLDRVETIDMAKTLSDKELEAFHSRKSQIIAELARTIQESDERSMQLVAEGDVSPEWTQRILWENTSDWNFDRISGEVGNGYMQYD